VDPRETEGLGDGGDRAGVLARVEERDPVPQPALRVREPAQGLAGALQLLGVAPALLARLAQPGLQVLYPLLGQYLLGLDLLQGLVRLFLRPRRLRGRPAGRRLVGAGSRVGDLLFQVLLQPLGLLEGLLQPGDAGLLVRDLGAELSHYPLEVGLGS